MTPLPNYRPKQLSLGPLEAEILNLVWELGSATVKEVHDRILADPDRELAYSSVTTVLRRLTEKGWLTCDKTERIFIWQSLVSRSQAQALFAYDRLQQFLAVGNPDIVATLPAFRYYLYHWRSRTTTSVRSKNRGTFRKTKSSTKA